MAPLKARVTGIVRSKPIGRGKELLEDGTYLEAMTAFNQVKNEFLSPRTLSSLAVGEVYFREEKHRSFIDVSFRLFVRSYPEHPEVPTALFRESEAFFKQRPSEFSIFPPSFERDVRDLRKIRLPH